MISAQRSSSLDAAKRKARDLALAHRQGLDAEACGRALAEHVLKLGVVVSAPVVAGFWPMTGEIDLRPLLYALHDRGSAIALPVTPARGHALSFRGWSPGDVLISERFGTRCPIGPVKVPDVLLIPLLAFDAAGGRLGYGGGYYDRTLTALPGRFKLGCAFAAQQVDAVPVGPYDIRLNAVATESGIIGCGD